MEPTDTKNLTSHVCVFGVWCGELPSKQITTNVRSVYSSEFPQQLLRTLIQDFREHDSHFDNQIATLASPGGRDATLAQAKPLTGLRARRNPHARLALERRHQNSGAKRSF